MRILAVVYCYPPLLVPASICYAKLVVALRRVGVEVDLVHIDPSTFDYPGTVTLDPELAALTPGDVGRFEVRSPEGQRWRKWIKELDRSRRLTLGWAEPKKREWLRPARAALDGVDLGRYDLLLSCSQPHANHLLGLELAERTGLPWVAYFSDPWTDNVYAEFANPRVREHHRRLEESVHARADRVLFTCAEMRDLVVSRHPSLAIERTGILPHAFVPEWYGDAAPRPDSAVFELLQTGSFYGPRTPAPLLDALEAVRRTGRLDALRIASYGGLPEPWAQEVARRDLGSAFQAHGFVPYLSTLRLMAGHDALLLVDAPLTATEESVFLPSKLVDYLGAGRPLVAVTPERGATARVVREVGGTLCAIERPRELPELLSALAAGEVRPSPPDPDAVAVYSAQSVGGTLASLFHEVVSR